MPWLQTASPYNVSLHLGAGGTNPKPLTLVCWCFTEWFRGAQHASGVPQPPLGHTYSFPARNHGWARVQPSTGNPGSCFGWTSVKWNCRDHIGLTTRSRLIQNRQEINALCFLSLPRKDGVPSCRRNRNCISKWWCCEGPGEELCPLPGPCARGHVNICKNVPWCLVCSEYWN